MLVFVAAQACWYKGHILLIQVLVIWGLTFGPEPVPSSFSFIQHWYFSFSWGDRHKCSRLRIIAIDANINETHCRWFQHKSLISHSMYYSLRVFIYTVYIPCRSSTSVHRESQLHRICIFQIKKRKTCNKQDLGNVAISKQHRWYRIMPQHVLYAQTSYYHMPSWISYLVATVDCTCKTQICVQCRQVSAVFLYIAKCVSA